MQGCGARDSEVQRCKELTQTVKRDKACIHRLCRDETTWEVEKFREEIALLIAHGADVRARRKGYTALHVAAKYGNANAVKACLTVSLEGLSSEDALDLELEMQSQAYGYDRGEEAREDGPGCNGTSRVCAST